MEYIRHKEHVAITVSDTKCNRCNKPMSLNLN